MAAVTCFRCRNGGYTTPKVRVEIPTPLQHKDVIPEHVVPPVVEVEPELCAACRAHAVRENAEAKARSEQRGEAG